jgi:hypothetical protein
MALLLSKGTPKYSRGDKQNAKQITREVEALAFKLYGLELYEKTGLSNLNKDISKGVTSVLDKMK